MKVTARCFGDIHGTNSPHGYRLLHEARLNKLTERDGEDLIFDLDVLRGWKEIRDDGLRSEHALPALGVLVCHEGDPEQRREFSLHGPETYVGRYHPQNGPVDVILGGLEDHEVYRLSAPHARFVMSARGDWSVRPMSPAATTNLNGTPLIDTRQQYSLKSGDTVTLGALDFHFRSTGVSYDEWLAKKKQILVGEDKTGLFLMRAGGICGPNILAAKGGRITVGRSFPRRGDLAQGPWRSEEQPDWDLARLFEWERKFIGFLHAAIKQVDDQWYIEPISQRQRTFVNRLEVSGETPLMPGDEIGLGSVLFHFHDPSDIRASTESHTAELPAVVNWREEHTNPRLEPIERDTGSYLAVDPGSTAEEDTEAVSDTAQHPAISRGALRVDKRTAEDDDDGGEL